jgi:DNA-binding LytR/AlgR family response regulator
MNCIIVFDDPLALNLLEENIKKIPFLNLLAVCNDAAYAMDALDKHNIDLLFMDIQLPCAKGLDMLRSLKNLPPVILVAAYPEHAVEGFELDVVDYLLKPVSYPRFLKAVQKAQRLFKIIQLAGKAHTAETEHVFVNANYSLVKIMLHEIAFIEGLKDYVRITLTTGKIVVTRLGMKAIEDKLNATRFMRIHRSYIIALDKIDSIQKAQLIIQNREIPIGDGYRQSLQSYVSGKNL